jgi:hypothetical protein
LKATLNVEGMLQMVWPEKGKKKRLYKQQ